MQNTPIRDKTYLGRNPLTISLNLPYEGLYFNTLSSSMHHFQIAGVRSTVATPILLCELQSSPLDDTWWLRTVQFWNSIAALPSTHLYKRIALHACHTAVTASLKNWAYYIFKGIRRLGYDLATVSGLMPWILLT